MGPAGFAAVALWVLAAAPQVEIDAGIETRTNSVAARPRTPVNDPVLEGRPHFGLLLVFPRTRLTGAYEPRFVLANVGRGSDTGVLHRLDLGAEHQVAPVWIGRFRASGAMGTTAASRPILDTPLEAAPTVQLLRRAQAEVSATVTGRPAPRATVTVDSAVLGGQGLDARSRQDAPVLRAARLGTSFDWQATHRDRIDLDVGAMVSRTGVGRRSVAATALGGLSRRLTASVDAWASVGVGVLQEDAPREAALLRLAPAASAGTAYRMLDDRLQGRTDVRIAPLLSTWDGEAYWRTELNTSARAILDRHWGASVLAYGVRVERPDGRATHVGELLLVATYSPRARLAIASGLWMRAQRGGGEPNLVETGALLSFAASGVPVGGVPVAAAPVPQS